MISVIIPTLNAQKGLPATFAALMPALIEGMIKEVIIVDAGSQDNTLAIAQAAGAKVISANMTGRGAQLSQGATAAKSNWLLFLHADTQLEESWYQEAKHHIENQDQANASPAAFRFALQDKGLGPQILTWMVALRCHFFHLPYGDQGLLINKHAYQKAGGYSNQPLMEDVDLIRRLKPRPTIFKSRAFTCPSRYQKTGYIKRSLRNLTCLAAYYCGVPPNKIKDWYEAP